MTGGKWHNTQYEPQHAHPSFFFTPPQEIAVAGFSRSGISSDKASAAVKVLPSTIAESSALSQLQAHSQTWVPEDVQLAHNRQYGR